MLNLSTEFTNETLNTSPEVSNPDDAVSAFLNGTIPANINNFTDISSFREATLGKLIINVTDKNALLESFARAIRSCPSESMTLMAIVSFAAPIAYAFEQPRFAMDALKRTQPALVPQHLWAVVAAMKKQMPSSFYSSLVVSQTPDALARWSSGK